MENYQVQEDGEIRIFLQLKKLMISCSGAP